MKETTEYNSVTMQKTTRTSNFWEDSLSRYSERKFYPDKRDNLHISGKGAVSIAHELRNQLTIIKGFLQLIEHKKELITKINLKRYCQLMMNGVHYTENVIEDLLLVQKPEVSQFVSENMVSLVKESMKKIEKIYPIQMDLDANVDLPLVNCVRGQMIKVFTDLFKLVPEDKTATINIETFNSTYLKITIVDEEAIASPRNIERIADDIDLNNEYGLDLIIDFNIVKNHGGIIQMYRNKSKGLMFEVMLPFISAELSSSGQRDTTKISE